MGNVSLESRSELSVDCKFSLTMADKLHLFRTMKYSVLVFSALFIFLKLLIIIYLDEFLSAYGFYSSGRRVYDLGEHQVYLVSLVLTIISIVNNLLLFVPVIKEWFVVTLVLSTINLIQCLYTAIIIVIKLNIRTSCSTTQVHVMLYTLYSLMLFIFSFTIVKARKIRNANK